MKTGSTFITMATPTVQSSMRRRRATIHWEDLEGSHKVTLEERLLIGSAEQVGLRIADARVSRLHAELELTEAGIQVRDVGSKNGTWVDRVRIERALLCGETTLSIASTPIHITFDASRSPMPLWPDARLGALIGKSEAMRHLFLSISQCGASDASVLVKGETGSGKELVAQALHERSKRAQGPFVVVDCAALPENLLEDELFGHIKGAFTGALTAREGAFEAASGGTVFLDEVGELPLSMQPKLLRVLESRTVRRLGQNAQAPVDVRVIAATHRDLEAMVASGDFREDLFFRLAVLPVHVPPLREHAEDIPLLLQHFLGGRVEVPDDLLAKLEGVRWAGNVRELRTFAERVAALGFERAHAMLRGAAEAPVAASNPNGLPTAVDVSIPFKELRAQWVEHLEREYVRELMRELKRDVAEVAERAGLDRSYVHRLVRKHSL